MTIKKRLFLSNLLMITVPLLLTGAMTFIWAILLYNAEHGISSAESYRTAAAVSMIILAVLVLLAVWATDQFLIRFVFRKIEQPLDILTAGVREIGGGNLDYRIEYDGKDEFKPVCDAFNDMAARLKASIEQTQREEESRKELLAGISHDLRSPLTSIRGFVEGLLDGIADTPQAQEHYLRTIARKVTEIDNMVSQLFAFSKLDLQEYPMECREMQLDFELPQLMQECRQEYAEKGLVLRQTPMPHYLVCADFEQFCRVVRNVMDNSAKYRKKETGTLTVSLNSKGDTCELILADDGPGVPQEALPKLFDVFYRSDPARKNPAGGSGLGLAIAEKIVEQMGGTIRAENVAGGGLAIIITMSGREGVLHGKDSDY